MGINKTWNYGFAHNIYLLVGVRNIIGFSNPSNFAIFNNQRSIRDFSEDA